MPIDPEDRPKIFRIDRYCWATAEIIYRMPDYHNVLQSFVWQHYDVAPDFPVLTRFLRFWTENLDGPIHSVRVARAPVAGERELAYAERLFTLN